ncbi:DUF5518 domain-containing protein [Natronorubrum bangense]|uniref:DUF5518 domain-containing protein n=2 Tax=Natronorubrum bangense TaxID=61858 RepID=L9WLI5_9EURY|nr:DUF5518 domain-containing protein [Natronorubrum bangense]ELY50350.1 hypothetical protein C494_06073 [Natronorubrum bangense JCM 10635]QCC54214.1 hypothetical protein DV706_06760 [Natronorubrum bangense]
MSTTKTLINAVIGAVVGVVLSFIPLSTVIGGVVAGFLEGPDVREGAIVGALAGAITFLPFAGIAIIGLSILGFGMGIAAAPIEGFAVVALAILVFVSVLFVYTVGLSLLGGYLGAYLAREYPDQHVRTRRAIGFSPSTGRSGAIEPTQPPRPRSDRPGDHDRGGEQFDTEGSSRDRDTERER